MKRFHVHINVTDIAGSIRFYQELFGAEPVVRKPDYAKWMLEDPRINFAISDIGGAPGIDHLGLQVDSGEELTALGQRLQAAGGTLVPENAAVCCYAQSDKTWTEDPQGTRWETFHTFGEATTYLGADAACATDGASCTPDMQVMKPMPAITATTASCCAPQSICC